MKKNRIILCVMLIFLVVSSISFAKKKENKQVKNKYEFTTIKALPITSIKNQYHSGTCWAFSTISFIESEAIRINNIKDTTLYPDFSEMFIVSHSYQDRADKYVRMDGQLTFAAGSEAGDVFHIVKDYGLVPQEVMQGLNYGTDKPVHNELDDLAKAYVQVIAKNPNKKLSTAWKKGFSGIMDSYLGACPTSFEYKGKEYTPASYRDSYKINADDYVALTSFSHHPFYKEFALEVADNWRWDKFYNLPIDEFMTIFSYAIENGYTIAWGSDVSEKGFNRDGLGIMPEDTKAENLGGSDQERWTGKTKDKKTETVRQDSVKEKIFTQEERQIAYDNKETTDDHGMHIYGIAKDQFGKKYFMVKNSWGLSGEYKGIWYVSEAFVRAKTMSIIVHKNAIPSVLKEKLGLK